MYKWVHKIAILLMILTLSACDAGSPIPTVPPPTPPVGYIPKPGWTAFFNRNDINALLVKENELWAATSGGVVRWNIDSGNYTQYADYFAKGLAGDFITSITQDSKGYIWTGSLGGGVSRFNGTGWDMVVTRKNGLAGDNVSSAVLDTKGNLWFGTQDNGISQYDGTRWQTYTTSDGLASNSTKAMAADKKGNVWVATDKGISKYDAAAWRTLTSREWLALEQVHNISLDSDGILWFFSYGIIGKYNGNVMQFITSEDRAKAGLDWVDARGVVKDDKGIYWFATDNGVSSYDGKEWQSFVRGNGLTHDDVKAVVVDKNGALWVGTHYGINNLNGKNWRSYVTAEEETTGGPSRDLISAVYRDSKGNLWFSTLDRNTVGPPVFSFDGFNWRNLMIPWPKYPALVSQIVQDDDGNLWFGTEASGLIKYDGNKMSFLTVENGSLYGKHGNFISALYRDPKGNIWLAGIYGSVQYYDGNTWKRFEIKYPVNTSEAWIKVIFQDRAGNMWFGTMDGLSVFDGSNWRVFTMKDGLPDIEIWSIIQDKQGNIWVGTHHGGIVRYDGNSWVTFNTKNVLP